MGKDTALLLSYQAQFLEPQERKGVGRAVSAKKYPERHLLATFTLPSSTRRLRSTQACGIGLSESKGSLGGHTNHNSTANKYQATALPLGSIKDLATSLLSDLL